jgi:hypothetical protein
MTPTLGRLVRHIHTARAWDQRIKADSESASRAIPERLRSLHAAVIGRASEGAAHSLILSGSTARGSRTDISDLDYHLVGDKIHTKDLTAELDLHVLSPESLMASILERDDFIQWSIRFGLVLFDDGTVREASRLIAEQRCWPDAGRKAEHAKRSLDLARRVVATGDSDGALIQVRTALSLAARAHLLSIGEFPMSRAELPDQLVAAGRDEAGAALEACIYGEPSLEALAAAVSDGYTLTELPTRDRWSSGSLRVDSPRVRS